VPPALRKGLVSRRALMSLGYIQEDRGPRDGICPAFRRFIRPSTTRRSEPPLFALPMSPCFSACAKAAPLAGMATFSATRSGIPNIIAVTVDLPLVPRRQWVLFAAIESR